MTLAKKATATARTSFLIMVVSPLWLSCMIYDWFRRFVQRSEQQSKSSTTKAF
jgi:hypothetical protein